MDSLPIVLGSILAL